jgi:hypothetical protein
VSSTLYALSYGPTRISVGDVGAAGPGPPRSSRPESLNSDVVLAVTAARPHDRAGVAVARGPIAGREDCGERLGASLARPSGADRSAGRGGGAADYA